MWPVVGHVQWKRHLLQHAGLFPVSVWPWLPRRRNNMHTYVINNMHTYVINNMHTYVINNVHTCIINNMHTYVIDNMHSYVINTMHTYVIDNVHTYVIHVVKFLVWIVTVCIVHHYCLINMQDQSLTWTSHMCINEIQFCPK